MNWTNEAWEEEQMSNLGCESVADLIEKVKQLDEQLSLAHDWVSSHHLLDDMEFGAFIAYIGMNSECCICGKAIKVPEGEVWSLGCWECYLKQEPDWREGEEE